MIRDWYDGYCFGDTDVYYPWDVMNYCDVLLEDPCAKPETPQAGTGRINWFCLAFPKEDVSTIQDMLHDYLWDFISVRNMAVRRNMKENFYYGMLFGLLQSQGSWLVRSNAERGEGYSDILLQTPDRVGMIIEWKYADDGNLEMACAKALNQIEERLFFVKYFSLKKASKFPFSSKGFSLLSAGIMHPYA